MYWSQCVAEHTPLSRRQGESQNSNQTMRQFTKQKSVTGADGRLLLNVLFKHIINETATTDASPAAVVLLSPASERILNAESHLSLVLVPRHHDFSMYTIFRKTSADFRQAFFIFNQKGEVRHISHSLHTLLTSRQVLISRLFRSDVK